MDSEEAGGGTIAGILNIGNTCYMGAAIQALANISKLSNFLIRNEQQLSNIQIVKEYVQMLKSILILKQPAAPFQLKEVISSMNSFFDDTTQHDSHEFIQFFVDALHESLKGIGREGIIADGEEEEEEGGTVVADGNDGIWQKAIDHWNKEVLNLRQGSIILDLFAGQFLSELRCPKCSYSSNTFELFTMLQLQIPIPESPESTSISYRVISATKINVYINYLRLPTDATIGKVKGLICKQCDVGVDNFYFVILNKKAGLCNVKLSSRFNCATVGNSSSSDADNESSEPSDREDEDDDTSDEKEEEEEHLIKIPFDDIDIWCFECPDEEDITEHMVCINMAEQGFMDDSQQKGLDDETVISINDCFVDFTRPERIDGSHCDHCNKSSPSSKSSSAASPTPLVRQLSFTRLPDILVICLKRFIYMPDKRRFIKRTVPVSFPMDHFDLSSFVSPDVPAAFSARNSRYFCTGIVTHYGELNYGHYCSYVRDCTTDEWFFCNDSSVDALKSNVVPDMRNAYMLFYQRVKKPC